jgi:phosphotriesterase-related protein
MEVKVNTVTGTISSRDLGKTLVHEHVLVGFPGWFMDARQPAFRRGEAVERVVDAFQALHAFGVRTVIDPCPMDMGRDVDIYAEVSQRTGINLICATGAYAEAMGITWTFNALSVDQITEVFIKEVEHGVGETGIRCGVIKIATGKDVVTPYERKLLTAAARAARHTGVPLISHTEGCTCGHDQIDITTGEGVHSSSLIVGHSCGTEDLGYQTSLAQRGSYVGFDRFGVEQEVSDAIRMTNLFALVAAGHGPRVVVSHDSVACWRGAIGNLDPDELRKAMPNHKLTHLFENIFPALRRMGMSDTQIDEIVIDNPRRYFEDAWAAVRSPRYCHEDPVNDH